MKKMYLILAACVAALFIPSGAHAHAQGQCVERVPCTIDTVGERVRQTVRQGTADAIRNTNSEGRVNILRRTLEECLRCQIEALEDGARRAAAAAAEAANSLRPAEAEEPDDNSSEPEDDTDPER